MGTSSRRRRRAWRPADGRGSLWIYAQSILNTTTASRVIHPCPPAHDEPHGHMIPNRAGSLDTRHARRSGPQVPIAACYL